MKKRIAIVLWAVAAMVFSAAAVDLSDLMNPDDVMLRRPAKSRPERREKAPSPKVQTPAADRAVAVLTNVVIRTDYVTRTNFVTKTDRVVLTNFVTQTDRVVQTNFVTQTDHVVQTNVVVEKVIDESEKKKLELQMPQ